MALPARNIGHVGEAAVQAIERQGWLDPLGDRLQPAVAGLYRAGGETGRVIRDMLHGTWLGHPLHPVLTDIPLGAWTVALVLDAMDNGRGRGFSRTADASIGLGLAGAVGAAATGLTDWHHTANGDRRTGLVHGLLNTAATALYAGSFLLRRRGSRAAGQGLAGAGFLLAVGAAYLGGHLVFGRRVGVDRAPRPEGWDEFISVLPEGELREGTPRRVHARDTAIVLVRRGSRVYALVETCAHLSGPLAEGTVEDDSIRCPWHGSRFALDDGRVLEGPSTFPQPCFEVRIHAGQIQVRARKS
jgi:nitrite reductase/ring-hydroxylating ferredoxin subunit/uncharacterized membrane protein